MAEQEQVFAPIVDPKSVGQEKAQHSYLADNYTESKANTGNWQSLMMLQKMYAKEGEYDEGSPQKAIADIAKEESKYLVAAMKALTGNSKAERNIQKKFGKNLEAAITVSKLLKNESDEVVAKSRLRKILSTSGQELFSEGRYGSIKGFLDPISKEEAEEKYS